MDDSGSCYIGIDGSIQDGNIQERVHLAHEIGHCVTGSFYSIHTAVDCRQRHENKADKWAVQYLIPVEDLDAAVANGCTEIWELAELFGVSDSERVIFTQNATHGLNIAIRSLLSEGGQAVISGYEHNAVTRPLYTLPNVELSVAKAPLFSMLFLVNM